MTYQEFAETFITRIQASLDALKNNLVVAGIQASRVTIGPVESDTVQDLRYRITAVRGSRTFIAYLEMTAAGFIDGQMALVITLYVEGNGGQIVTSYSSGTPVRYDQIEGIEFLLSKLAQVEGVVAGELTTSARAFLQV